mgnify:CR=1 FL=1
MINHKNIILIGFMGCGKSTVGYELAKKLNFNFIDADAAIEAIAGENIHQIFSERGESAFRKLETDYLKQLCEQNIAGNILATGGGMALSEENQKYMKQLGVVVWLDAKFDLIWQRVKSAKHRPLVTNTEEAKVNLQTLYKSRVDVYAQACDLKVEIDRLTLDEIILGIIESIRYAKES